MFFHQIREIIIFVRKQKYHILPPNNKNCRINISTKFAYHNFGRKIRENHFPAKAVNSQNYVLRQNCEILIFALKLHNTIFALKCQYQKNMCFPSNPTFCGKKQFHDFCGFCGFFFWRKIAISRLQLFKMGN